MSYQVIARKWRPQTFDEVTGQEHITQTLRNAIEHDRLHHAYIFSGARGVGKTTTARLLAKALNCHKTDGPNVTPCASDDPTACPSCLEIAESRSMDVLEIDAASHTGIDDVRDIIIENITVNPARDRYKVFIIDEFHQLSKAAFNALLKTLEEPPKNVLFVMATTELHKVPETITSRCQAFQFRTISLPKIFDRLKLIADAEKVDISDDALREIARSGEGSMRDAQSNFDQVISFAGEKIAAEDVSKALGMAGVEMLIRVVRSVAEKRPAEAIKVVDELIAGGQDLRNFARDLMALFRDLMVFKLTDSDPELLEGSMLTAATLSELSEPFSGSDILRFFNSVAATETELKDSTRPRFTMEIGLVKLTEMRRLAAVEDLLERLGKLEVSAGNGIAPDASAAAATVSASPADVPEKKTLKSDEPVAEAAETAEFPPAEEPPDMPGFDDFEPIDSSPPLEAPDDIDLPVAVDDFARYSSLPTKMAPLAAEDLEHVDHEKLDDAFELKLELSGDDLRPIAGADKLVASLLGIGAKPVSVAASNGAAAAPARDLSAYMPPELDLDAENAPPGELAADATEAEIMEYAKTIPAIRRAMRIFRAEVVEARRT